jgi:DNA-binding MarR family transcriptional regulator
MFRIYRFGWRRRCSIVLLAGVKQEPDGQHHRSIAEPRAQPPGQRQREDANDDVQRHECESGGQHAFFRTALASIRVSSTARMIIAGRLRRLRNADLDQSGRRRSGPPYALSTREIARRTLVTAGAISQRVARAERDGLVQRTPGATGRRTVLVSLTAEGQALIESSVDAVLGREAALVKGLSEPERASLIGLLEKLTTEVRRCTDAES